MCIPVEVGQACCVLHFHGQTHTSDSLNSILPDPSQTYTKTKQKFHNYYFTGIANIFNIKKQTVI